MVHRMLAVFALTVLSLAATPAQEAPAGDDPVVARVQAFARALMDLSGEAAGRMLYDASERLLIRAQDHGIPKGESDVALKRLREQRIESIRGSTKEAYERFLATAYPAARKAHEKAEERLLNDALGALLRQAQASERSNDADATRRALRAAWELSPGHALFASRRDEVLTSLREELRARLSLDQLELGDLVAGGPVTLDDLKGKVVLWRSFSL
jgi:hypothetical protein